MKEYTLSAYPLITIDPLTQVWSQSQTLYGSETKMWTGAPKPINGNVRIDGEVFRFMGLRGAKDVIPQQKVEIGLTSTAYYFSDNKILLKVTFTSPMLLSDLKHASRPVNYISVEVSSIDNKKHDVQVFFDISEKLSYRGTKKLTKGGLLPFPEGKVAYIGRVFQKPIDEAGDRLEIDWGWLYVAGQAEILISSIYATQRYYAKDIIKEENNDYRKVILVEKHSAITPETPLKYFFAIAYDDTYALNYFGEYKRGYWKKFYTNIIDALQSSIKDYDETLKLCADADQKLENQVLPLFGEDYLKLLYASYRQVMAGHKLIDHKDELIFVSKENSSNGCAATVDVTYPSSPLFLVERPELVKAMLEPVFKFARTSCWNFDFAPHDAGVYPYVTGQVYGLPHQYQKRNIYNIVKKHVYASVKPKNYIYEKQMPVEESANMIILSAAYYNETGDLNFIQENADLFSKWADFLVKQGISLDLQLSTDDFGGSLPKNVNLAIKSIIAICLWGKLLKKMGIEKADGYITTAHELAKELVLISNLGDRLAMIIDDRDSWSTKYNLVWDKLFELGLFEDKIYQNETDFYYSKTNKYGLPMDGRNSYAKSDWMIWASVLCDDSTALKKYSACLSKMQVELSENMAYPDLFDTITNTLSRSYFTARTVQGGMWLPLYAYKLKKEGKVNYLF